MKDRPALRFMDKPSKDGNSADCWSSGVGNLDVHYSSGVANHFATCSPRAPAPRRSAVCRTTRRTCNSST